MDSHPRRRPISVSTPRGRPAEQEGDQQEQHEPRGPPPRFGEEAAKVRRCAGDVAGDVPAGEQRDDVGVPRHPREGDREA